MKYCMKKFMDDDFLLSNKTANELYNDYAKYMPIFDYHCHLDAKEIYEDKRYENITQLWLYGDHYKWRLMRNNGIDEKFITGDADDYDKYMAWVETLQYSIGNPLYHWTHLELKRYFNIDETLNVSNAKKIWDNTKSQLKNDDGYSAKDFITKSNVKAVITTNDPTDELIYHRKLKEDKSFNVKVIPAFRFDNALDINKRGFTEWVKKLENVSNTKINNYDDFLSALENRMEFFKSNGCLASDQSMRYMPYVDVTREEVEEIFNKAINGEKISTVEEDKYRTYTLNFAAQKYYELGWVMQLHIGVIRNNNTLMFEKIGPDTGFDSINDASIAYSLGQFLDLLERKGVLTKTIIYPLNPVDFYVVETMIGNFQTGGIAGKMQLGPAWWYNDCIDGIKMQLRTVANLGLLSRFIGMLTDSRSFLSYVRHDYFRRILCDMIGRWVENGEVPRDYDLLGKIVKDISFNNAKEYFNINI